MKQHFQKSHRLRFGFTALLGLVFSQGLLAETPPTAPPPVEISEKRAKFFMSHAGFQGMVAAVAKVNHAMRVAAENPMDKWRRENVRTAVAAMPAAIQGLAQEFFSGKLHDDDFPAVQSMLGGFVDVSAADRYKKFLRNPDPALIPEVGPNFPGNFGPRPPTITSPEIALSDPKFQTKKAADPLDAVSRSGELVDLGRDLASLTKGKDSKEVSDGTVGFSEEAETKAIENSLLQAGIGEGSYLGKAVAAQVKALQEQAAEGKDPKYGQDEFLQGVNQELSLLEGLEEKKDEEECDPEEDKFCEQDDEVFDLESDKKNKKYKRKKKKGKQAKKHFHGDGHDHQHDHKTDPKEYKLVKKARNWRASTALNWSAFLLPIIAKAESPEQSQRCQQCIIAKNGQGLSVEDAIIECTQLGFCTPQQGDQALRSAGAAGGGGGSTGEKRAAALGAIFSSLAAMSAQIGTAAAKASADKHIASEAARAAITQTQDKASTQKYLSDNQVAMNGDVNRTQLANFRARSDGETTRMKKTLAAFADGQNTNREIAAADRELENYKATEFNKLQLYALRGQAALQRYAVMAQSLVGSLNGGTPSIPMLATVTGAPPIRTPFSSGLGSRFSFSPPSRSSLLGLTGTRSSMSLLSARRTSRSGALLGAYRTASLRSMPLSLGSRLRAFRTRSSLIKSQRAVRGSVRTDHVVKVIPARERRNPAYIPRARAVTGKGHGRQKARQDRPIAY